MTTTTYRGCTITRTGTTTSVRRSAGNSLRTFEAIVPLYEISGAVTKERGKRPFLTSIAEAKEYVANTLAGY